MSEREFKAADTMRVLNVAALLFSSAIATGSPVNGEMMKWYEESLQKLAPEEKPPEPKDPPRRPNAMGRLALEGI